MEVTLRKQLGKNKGKVTRTCYKQQLFAVQAKKRKKFNCNDVILDQSYKTSLPLKYDISTSFGESYLSLRRLLIGQ